MNRARQLRLFHKKTDVEPDLDKLLKEVMLEHEFRLDRCETIPLQRRPFKHRPRPQTAIISECAQKLIAQREGRARK